jgi:hypothetical protein
MDELNNSYGQRKEFNSFLITVPLKAGGNPQKKRCKLFQPGSKLPASRVNNSSFYKTHAAW